MRKYQQRQILTLVETLFEANAEIKRLFSKREFSAVNGLLADCQEFVVQIGSYIENIEGEGTRTVSLLEDFHDDLYNASVELGEAASSDAFVRQHRKQLVNIEASVKTELKPEKIEIVFLPYKASMWDSLESVWLAARDDPMCDVYVVPIPYYDKLQNGVFGKMHDESNLYPDYVPVVSWREYDLETRRPDAIFIHNPYDDSNYVTTIHPDFYSSRIKRFTDLLVYIPYFVVMNDFIEESFCLSPGVANSDMIAVQSEKVRDTYIGAIKAYEKENNCSGLFGDIRHKIVALGSPKFDKVINSKPEDFKLPAEWKALIERPDGTRKPVILYNTSVAAILQGNEKYLEKLHCVLDTFRKRNDVVLWWRPHPLNEAAYESMRGWLLDEYVHLIAEYKRDGFGIYDDTADLSRAIALTDAYYGDGSSLVPLYECAGKKVLIQNVDASPFSASPPRFQFAFEYDNSLWIISPFYDGILRLDVESGMAVLVTQYQKVSDHMEHTFRSVIAVNNKLFCVPGRADNIAVFDIERNAFEDAILIPPSKIETNPYSAINFNYAVTYKDSVFFIPGLYPAILKYDINTKRLESFDDWVGELTKLSHSDWYYFWKSSCSVENGKLVLPSARANAVVVFDMEDCTSKVYTVGARGVCYTDCCFDGRYYWLAPAYTDKIIKWDMETGAYKEINIITKGKYTSAPGHIRFGGCCYAGGYVWMLPSVGDVALKIDVRSEEVSIAHEFQSDFEEVVNPPEPFVKYTYVKAKDGEITAFSSATDSILKFDSFSGEMKKTKVTMTQADAKRGIHCNRLFPSVYKSNRCYEMTDIYLDKYFELILAEDFVAVNKGAEDQDSIITNAGNAGVKIFTHCKKVLQF